MSEDKKQLFEELRKKLKDGKTLCCDGITDGDIWDESWTECPLCGAVQDAYGMFVHKDVQ